MSNKKRTHIGMNQTVKKEMMCYLRRVVRRNYRKGNSNPKWN